MSHGMRLLVHCKSGDTDLGMKNLTAGTEFEWKFKMNFFDRTVYCCYWCPEKGKKLHANFNVFWKDEALFYRCNYSNCFWVARDDGLYLKNLPEHYDELRHHWEPGWMDTNYV
ncbi:hypothetical protein ACOSQ2_003645 [Xanthoceras sorbifolium]